MYAIYMPVTIINDKRGHERERMGEFGREKKQEQYNYIIISKNPNRRNKITEIGA